MFCVHTTRKTKAKMSTHAVTKNPYAMDPSKLSEAPPSYKYGIEMASEHELAQIVKKLSELGRQTMNFRTSKTAQAIVLKNLEDGGKIVGWQGIDIGNRKFPEKFSLHLEPEFRRFLLGVVLELAYAVQLKNEGIDFAYVRMDSTSNAGLKDWRLNTGVFTEVPREHFPTEWLNMCNGCELHKISCNSQIFIQLNVHAYIEFGMRRLKIDTPLAAPGEIELKPDIVRSSSVDKRNSYQIMKVA